MNYTTAMLKRSQFVQLYISKGTESIDDKEKVGKFREITKSPYKRKTRVKQMIWCEKIYKNE